MGCGESKVDAANDDVNNDVAKLKLSSSQLKAFKKGFSKIDQNGNGTINIDEFMSSLKVDRTVVSEEVFEDMDRSNDGLITFREFTLLTWRFCTRGLDSIAEFAFDIYDTDNSSELTKGEIKEMMIESFGKLTEKNNVNSLIHAFDKDGDMKISKKEFLKTVRKKPNILQPAMRFQSILRSHIGDEDFWKKLCDSADVIYEKPEVRELFKSTPRKIHVIRKTKKHATDAKQESLDVKDTKHAKVNAHYYKEHHDRNLKHDEEAKKAGKKDMYSLN